MWNLTPFGKTRLPLSGVPWRDLTDEEMSAAEARHPGIGERGYFAKAQPQPETPAETEPTPTPTRRRSRFTRTETPPDAEVAAEE